MALSHHLTQGGQTFLHRFRMFKQILWLASWLSGSLFLGTFILLSWLTIPLPLWVGSYHATTHALERWLYTLSHPPHAVDGSTALPYPSQHTLHLYQQALWQKQCLENLRIALILGLLSYPFLFIFWRHKGQKDKESILMKGQSVDTLTNVARMIRAHKQASFLHIGDLPLIKDTETQHLLMAGTTGSGKTTCFHHLLPQIRNQKAIVVDTTGELIQRYYDPQRDKLLNPYDPRSQPWHPWGECQEDYHIQEIAENLIPQTHHDPFWSDAARIVLTEALKKSQDHRQLSQLLTLLHHTSLHTLHQTLKDTPAASIIDPTTEKTAASIRATLGTTLRCLALIPDTATPFSLRQWIQQDKPSDAQDGWVFLHMMPEQRAALRPLLSTWVSIAIKGLMGCVPDRQRRLWFILDELPSLQKLKDLTLCLSEGRKYGACMVLGVQNIPQLEAHYGPPITQSILDLCSTKIIFRMAGFEVAQRMSASLGQRDILEVQEGLSYGANDMRDGVNLSLHRRTESAVSPYDLLSLEPLEAYVRLPGKWPIVKIQLGR